MKRIISLILALSFFSASAAPYYEGEEIQGTYRVNELTDEIMELMLHQGPYLELNADKSFTVFNGHFKVHGNYKISGNDIILKPEAADYLKYEDVRLSKETDGLKVVKNGGTLWFCEAWEDGMMLVDESKNISTSQE